MTHYLYVRQGDVEVGSQVGMPDDAHISEEKTPQIALLGGQIPHACHLGEDLLLGQQVQLVILKDGSSQL